MAGRNLARVTPRRWTWLAVAVLLMVLAVTFGGALPNAVLVGGPGPWYTFATWACACLMASSFVGTAIARERQADQKASSKYRPIAASYVKLA